MEIKNVGVIGCGQMGGGIVQTAAQAGFDVKVSEVNETFLSKGLNAIKSNLSRNVEKSGMTKEEMNAVLGRIHGTVNIADFSDRDLVVEAVIEDLEMKKKLFAELDKICPAGAILATNTSCLSIIDMAMTTKRADKVFRYSRFQPGAGNEAGGSGENYCHQCGNPVRRQAVRGNSRQESGDCPG